MQASFTDLVGTTVVPARCLDSTELRELAPALDTTTEAHDMTAQASEAAGSGLMCGYSWSGCS